MSVLRRKVLPLVPQPEQPRCTCARSPLASVKEAAEYLHVSARSIREMKASGVLRLVPHPDKARDAKPWRFLFRDLDEHIEKMRRQAA
jgi:Helix-turn-helix domain